MDTKAEIRTLLSGQTLGVIASVAANSQPQAATVAFWSSDDLTTLVIGTSDTSRKARNVAENGKIAFVVTDEARRCTVQIEGTAKLLDSQESSALLDEYYKKLPFLVPARTAPGRCHFVLEPHWLRFTDITTMPWTVKEVTLVS